MDQFFISCSPGFESTLAEEVAGFWSQMIDLDGKPTKHAAPAFKTVVGGLLLETDLHLGLQLNFFTKIGNRILLRLFKFEARYFDQFEKKIATFDLSKVINEKEISLKIESHKSRLNNEKSIIEATTSALKKQKITVAQEAKLTLYIRIEKDVVQVSIDTTGEHLHKRGYGIYRSEAPLRETLAAYLVLKLKSQVMFNSNLNIIDPFAGSGTLLFESLCSSLPNFHRIYSWFSFVRCPKLFLSPTWRKNYRHLPELDLPVCYAYDINEKSFDIINKNLENFKDIFSLDQLQNSLKDKLAFNVTIQDSATLKLSNVNGPKWIITNPPYGIRLDNKDAEDIISSLSSQVDGLVFIHPDKWRFNLSGFKRVLFDDFYNQGLKLKLSIWKKIKK